MPRYARRFKRKRRYVRRARRPTTRRAVRAIARREIYRNTEWKEFSSIINNSVPSTGLTYNLIIPGQGDSDQQRVGDEIICGSVKGNYQITLNAGTGTPFTLVRVIIFQWYGVTTPTINNILSTTVGAAPFHPWNTDQAPSYKILLNRLHTVKAFIRDHTSATYHGVTVRGFKVKPPRKKIHFQAGGTNGSNKLYICIVSDEIITANEPNMYISFKGTFADP